MREVVAECDKPVMLYSIGKDSAVMLHLARKAFYPAQAAVPAAARRHDLEVPRHVRVPRRAWRASSASSCSSTRTRKACAQGINPFDHGSADPHRHDEDRRASSRRSTSTASTRPSAARAATRRRSRAKERIFSFRTGAAPLGPEEPAPRALAPLQRAQAQGRVHPRLPALELDRARRLAVHLPARTSRSCRSTSPPSARWSSATAR